METTSAPGERDCIMDTYSWPARYTDCFNSLRERNNGYCGIGVTLCVLLDQVVKQLDVDAARIFLCDAQNNSLSYAVGCGFPHEHLDAGSIQFGDGLASHVASRNRPFYTKDLSHPDHSLVQNSKVEREHFTAYCGVPLTFKGRLRGVLEVFYRQSFDMSKEWFDHFNDLASIVAIAVDNVEQLNRILIADDQLNHPSKA